MYLIMTLLREGAQALSQLKQLQTLNVRGNQIGNEGAQALSQLKQLQYFRCKW